MKVFLPVILGDGATVLHQAPLVPWSNLVAGRIPDALTPDDVLEVKPASVVHDPFGDGAAEVVSVSLLWGLLAMHSTSNQVGR